MVGVKESRQGEQRERAKGREMPPFKGTKQVTGVGGDPRDERTKLKEGKLVSRAAVSLTRTTT